MRAIDLNIRAEDLAETFDHMRVWLDREHCVPVDFDQTGDRAGMVHLRVSFRDDRLADAFRREFAGLKAAKPV